MIRTKIKVWAFKLACHLLKFSVELDLASIGMTSSIDRITMLIFTAPELTSKALEAASHIAKHDSDTVVDPINETVH